MHLLTCSEDGEAPIPSSGATDSSQLLFPYNDAKEDGESQDDDVDRHGETPNRRPLPAHSENLEQRDGDGRFAEGTGTDGKKLRDGDQLDRGSGVNLEVCHILPIPAGDGDGNDNE